MKEIKEEREEWRQEKENIFSPFLPASGLRSSFLPEIDNC